MKKCCFVLMLLLLLVCATSAFATNWFVATNGSDSTGNGSIGSPYATIEYTALNHALPGDTIYLRAGTYTAMDRMGGDGGCPNSPPNRGTIGGAPGAPITIASYDGNLAAVFNNSLLLVRAQYVNVVGIDFIVPYKGNGGATHPIQITSGCTGGAYPADYYTSNRRGHHIQVLNCRFHDWTLPGNFGMVKVNQVDYVTLQDCELYHNPLDINDTHYGMQPCCIDFVWVNYSTIRRFFFHDFYGSAIYTKGGSQYNVAEQNVIVNAEPTGLSAGFQTSDGTGSAYTNPATTWETEYYIVRNNIIGQATRGAIMVGNAHAMYIYNNLFVDVGNGTQGVVCGGPCGHHSLNAWFAYIYARDLNDPQDGCYNQSQTVRIFNNIFLSTTGAMSQSTGNTPYAYQMGNPTDWQAGNNNFYNNGNAIPAGNLTVDGHLFDPNNETGATIGNPALTLSGTPSTWQGWVNYYRPLWNSQSNAMLLGKGSSTAGNAPYPAAMNDIESNPRPRSNGWDIGPYEYQGTAVTPVANFSGNIQNGMYPQLWGTPGAGAFDFNDLSSGGPTSWSWTFGDQLTSTAENPSHTYTSMGTYTVALTATNSAGNNTCTKTNYITIKALNAAFTASPTTGYVTQVVNFTDQSTDSPTAWSWTFGDNGTSTLQNPSHTYTSAGTDTVALTATNANGSDTCTKSNYITISPFQANFTASPTWGPPPLAVQFTDASLNSATAWSWTFGDGGTSTVRNPSHTYSSAGYYTVSLYASNAYGNNTCTKTNFITVCSSYVYVYPTAYSMPYPPGGDQHLVSGSLTDLQAPDGNCMVFASETENKGSYGVNWCNIVLTAPSGYSPSQIAGIVMDYRTKVDPPSITDLNGMFKWPCNVAQPPRPYPSTLTSYTNSLSCADAITDGVLDSNGNLTMDECDSPYSTTETYNIWVDWMRWTVYLNPSGGSAPVANFSGTPTIGAPPLAVSFTDSSTNSPTAWSWTFGDGGSSTAQNPAIPTPGSAPTPSP